MDALRKVFVQVVTRTLIKARILHALHDSHNRHPGILAWGSSEMDVSSDGAPLGPIPACKRLIHDGNPRGGFSVSPLERSPIKNGNLHGFKIARGYVPDTCHRDNVMRSGFLPLDDKLVLPIPMAEGHTLDQPGRAHAGESTNSLQQSRVESTHLWLSAVLRLGK